MNPVGRYRPSLAVGCEIELQDNRLLNGSIPMIAEARRSRALHDYGVLDTPREVEFDDLARIAAEVCGTPIAVVNFVDTHRQFFKAEVGLGVRETPLETSFCGHAILTEDLMVVPDATQDPRFACNPLVTEAPGIRFYAGALLKTPDGLPIGTMCVLDYVPRELDETQLRTLTLLARQAMTQLAHRRAISERDTATERLEMALNASGVIGLWDWMVDTDLLHGDANFARLYGLDIERTAAGLTMEQYQEFVLPEDIDNLRARIRATFEHGADFLVEYRLRIPGTGLRWVECKGRMIYDAAGRPVRFAGSAIDITARKDSETRTRRLAAIVEQSGDFIAVADLDGSVTMVNEAGRDMVGLTDPASVQGTTIQDYFDPAQWPEIAATVFPAVQRDGQWRGELRFRHFQTGELIPVIYDVIALRGDDGAVVAYATVTRDIRDQKRAEAQQRILNEELSHRMKNTLAMVQAIATQTLRGVTEKDAVAAFRKRIHAIASAHNVLLQENWSAAKVGAVVRAVLRTFEMEDRFDISGPEVVLGPRATLSLSLLLHELATNALKYGALSSGAGRVKVDWDIERSDQEDLVLKWTECGGPAPRQPDRQGFGSRLIEMGLSGTGGSAVCYPASGVEAMFRAPLAEIRQS